MIELHATYTVSPNKRLSILAAPAEPLSGAWADDLAALNDAFATPGSREVRFRSPFGWMQGVLHEKNALRDRRRTFEGHVWFQPAAPSTTP